MNDVNIRVGTILNTKSITQAALDKDANIKKLSAKITAILDTSKIKQTTLNKDGSLKKLELKIKPTLDMSPSSISRFQKQINSLAKLAKVTLKVNVDTTAATNALNNITKKAQQASDSSLNKTKIANYQSASQAANTKSAKAFSSGGTFDTASFNRSLGIGSTTGINAQNSALAKLFSSTTQTVQGMSNLERRVLSLNPSLQQLAAQTRRTEQYMRELGTEGKKTGQTLFDAAKKFAEWIVIGTLIMQPIRAIKEGVSYIMELDNAMNEVRIVTGQTQAEVEKLAVSYNNLGKEMSVTTTEIASTAADLYRQGLGGTEVEDRMKSIIEYAKISSISLKDANQIITATANATQEDTQKIIDIFALLGDTTASGKHMCPSI